MKTRNNKKQTPPIPGEEEKIIPGEPVKPKRHRKYISVVNMISLIRRSINSSLTDPDIMESVAKHGYNEETFQAALDLVDEVEKLYVLQGDMRITKEAATRKKNEMGKEAEKMISRFVKTAQLAFDNDPDMLDKFKSPGQRRQNFDAWLEMAKVFYVNVFSTPGALEGFLKHQVTREDLEAGRQRLLDVENQYTVQFGLDGDKQVMTEQLYKVYSKLRKWWSEYRYISRLALKDNPQTMEKLGIAVPTRKGKVVN